MSRDYVFEKFDENKEIIKSRVEYGIESFRKGDARIKVVDKDNNPIPEAVVKFDLKNHEFKHGANIFMLDEFETEEKNKIYREEFKNVFNLATLPFYWSDLEPEKGKPRFEKDSSKVYRRPAPDLCVEYCKENGIEPKEHCLVYDFWTPDWLKGASIWEMKKQLEIRMERIAERYKDKIPSWEVINETLIQPYKYGENQTLRECEDLVEWSFKTAEKYFPNNRLIMNETNVAWDNFMWDRTPYYMQVERALSKGTRIDSIGMQYHMFFRKEYEKEKAADIYYDPIRLYKVMDQFAKFGKPLQITEITIPAYSNSSYDEDVQAELIRRLYEIWFSHPAMEAIIYWNMVDGYAAFAPMGDMKAGENYFYGGLMDFNMRQKPSLKVIKKLFNETWHTQGTEKTDDTGLARFRGFYGEYDVTVSANGKNVPAKLTVTKDKVINEFVITIR